MSSESDTTEKPKIQPQGNVDLARCKNGVIRVVGWMLWSVEDQRQAKISLRSLESGGKSIDLPTFPDPRPDVNEYLKIDPSIQTGFAGRHSLNAIAMSDLPVGVAQIVASDPKGEFEDRVIGTVNIEWPEAPFRVENPAEASETADDTPAPVEEKRGFFKRLWSGSVGGDADMMELIDLDAFTAKNLLRAFERIDGGKTVDAGHASAGLFGLAQRLKSASANDGLIVIIDHDYGGGANTFSSKLTAQHVSTGNGVLRISYNVQTGLFAGHFTTPSETTDIRIESFNNLFRLLTALPSFAIQMNSMWTYPETYLFLDNILRMRLFGFTKRLEFFAHDHMPICPSLFLLNNKGVFCGVPEDIKTCNSCLRRSHLDFKAYYPQTDVESWRNAWQSLMVNCDLIRFFSTSTWHSYVRAFPWLADNPNVVVQGHAVKDLWTHRRYSRDRALANKASDDGLKIAVFGFISEHKGSGVLKSMSDAILKQRDDTRIYVFGSLEGKAFGRYGAIDVMGPYAPVEMLDLCEDNGIDIAFMPSICPETFSFSTKELSLVGVPVASFGFGGQSDIVENYEHGHIVKRGTGLSLLRQFKAIEKAGFMQPDASA